MQRETEGRFCCRGHPFCPLWRNMYTDIDIFKEDINFFLNDKEGKQREQNSGELWKNVIKMSRKAVETGDGSQRQEKKSSEAPLDIQSLFNYWQYAYGNRLSNQRTYSTWKQRGIKTRRLPGRGRIGRSFGTVDEIHRMDGTTRLYFRPVHGVATCFVFLRLVDGQHWLGVRRGGRGRVGGQSHQTIEKVKDSLFEECEGVFLAVIPEEAVIHEKANETKINKQPNKKQKQNTSSDFKDKLLTRSSPFLSWLLVPQFFLTLFRFIFRLILIFYFIFYFLELFLLWASQERLSGSR